MLHSEHLVVKKSTMVLLDGLISFLEVLEHDCCRTEELPKLVAVESALLQLANLLEQGLM